MSRRVRVDGYVSVSTAESVYMLPLEQFHAVYNAWQRGAAFYTTEDGFYGGIVSIKLARVETIGTCPSESIAARIADDDAAEMEDRQRKRANGLAWDGDDG